MLLNKNSAKFGARSVPGFLFPENEQGVEEYFVCEKSENKAARENGDGLLVDSKRTLSDSRCSKVV